MMHCQSINRKPAVSRRPAGQFGRLSLPVAHRGCLHCFSNYATTVAPLLVAVGCTSLAAPAPAISIEESENSEPRHSSLSAATIESSMQQEQAGDSVQQHSFSETAAPVGPAPPVTFASLGVDKLLLAGLAKSGIHGPAPIQEAAIPMILSGANTAVQSFTGSGKTLAYLLPVLTMAVRRADDMTEAGTRHVPVQALVVAPSQELAMQIVRVAQALLPPAARRAIQQCIGGANAWRQQEALLANPPLLVVGTPGRLAEMIRYGALQLHHCPQLVLDEADQLLAPHFNEDMGHITVHAGKKLSSPRQTVLVSATLTESVLKKTEKWSPGARYVGSGPSPLAAQPEVDAAGSTAGPQGPRWGWGHTGWGGSASPLAPKTFGSVGGVEQAGLVPVLPPQLQHFFVVADVRDKADTLRRVLHARGITRALVFMNFQQRLQDVQFKLEARHMQVASLHGEMDKMVRANVLNDFRRGRLRALIVSDVVARGLDVPDCDAVFHLELPSNAAHYAHRAGRTGRMGAVGTVVSVVERREVYVVEKLAAALGVPILEAHMSHGEFALGAPRISEKQELQKKVEFAERQAARAKEAASKRAEGAKSTSASTTASTAADESGPAESPVDTESSSSRDRSSTSSGTTSNGGTSGSSARESTTSRSLFGGSQETNTSFTASTLPFASHSSSGSGTADRRGGVRQPASSRADESSSSQDGGRTGSSKSRQTAAAAAGPVSPVPGEIRSPRSRKARGSDSSDDDDGFDDAGLAEGVELQVPDAATLLALKRRKGLLSGGGSGSKLSGGNSDDNSDGSINSSAGGSRGGDLRKGRTDSGKVGVVAGRSGQAAGLLASELEELRGEKAAAKERREATKKAGSLRTVQSRTQ